MEIITTNKAPLPAGHYSQAIVTNDLVFVSGQLPIDPKTGKKNIGPIEEQTEVTIKNLDNILIEAGSDLAHVLKITVYISNINLWDRVNTVYARLFGSHKPARTVVPTRELHYGFQIEIDAIALRTNPKKQKFEYGEKQDNGK